MNPVFWVLVILGLIFVWFCLSFTFKWIGHFFVKLFDDAMSEINEREE